MRAGHGWPLQAAAGWRQFALTVSRVFAVAAGRMQQSSLPGIAGI